MVDVRLRDLERAASTGDVHARVRLLTEQVRAGHSSRLSCPVAIHDHNPLVWATDRSTKKVGRVRRPCGVCHGTGFLPIARTIQLAAVLGDQAARLTLGWPRFHGPDCTQETIGPRNEYITHVRARGCLFVSLRELGESLFNEGRRDLDPMTGNRNGRKLFLRAAVCVLRLRDRSPEFDRLLDAVDDWLNASLVEVDDRLAVLRSTDPGPFPFYYRPLLDYATGRLGYPPSLQSFALADTDDGYGHSRMALSDGEIRTAVQKAIISLAIP